MRLGQHRQVSDVHARRDDDGALGIIQAGPDAVRGAPPLGDVQGMEPRELITGGEDRIAPSSMRTVGY
jgi:hypothetical protein